MDRKKKIFVDIAKALIWMFVGVCIATAIYYTAPPEAPAPPHITTPAEIQQMLVDAGEDIKVDSIIGPETLKVWYKVTNNQEASKWDPWYKETK